MNHYHNNREIYNNHKTKCCVCGEDAKCCLEFHHMKEKNFNISKSLKHITPQQLLEELNKTCLLCANCHRKLHNGKLNTDTKYLLEHKVNVDEELYKHTSEKIYGLINLENNR